MGADYQDMIAKLQMQQAQQQNPGPSFMGLQAQQDPNTTAAILKRMQDQQYVNEQGNDRSNEWSFLANAGQKDFARVGQGLGNLLGLGQPPQLDNSRVMAQRQALAQANQDFGSAVNQPGADPNQAQIQVLTKLAQQGIPGAADLLEKAQTTMLKNAATQAETRKNNNQADSYTATAANLKDEQRHRAFEEGGQTWNFVSEKDGVQLYKNANGEPKVVTTQPSKTIPGAPVDPNALAGSAADVANYKIPENQIYGRGMTAAQKAAFHDQVTALNPDYDQRNFKQSNDAIKAFGPAGTQGQMILKTQNSYNHLQQLQDYNDALAQGVDPKVANSILNKLTTSLGLPAGSTVQAVAPIVASEVMGGLVKGGGGQEERAEKAHALNANLDLSPKQASDNIKAMRGLLAAQYKNNKNLYEKTTLRKDFESQFPLEGGITGEESSSAPASSGWGTAVPK